MSDPALVEKRFRQLAPYFDERLRRLWAAAEARTLWVLAERSRWSASG